VIFNLTRGTLDTLLRARDARKLGVYKAYVSDFEWLSDTTLKAWIPDGDVGVTTLTINVHTSRVTPAGYEQGDEDSVPPYQGLADTLGRLYPGAAPAGATPSDVFGSGLDWPTVHGRGFVLMQKRYSGADGDVWLYRLDRPAATRILRLPDDARSSLAGGFVAGRDIIFGAGASKLILYRYRGGSVRPLLNFAVKPQASSIAIRAQRGDSTWFVLTLRATSERGNNPGFLYDGERLVSLGTYSELADLDVHLPTHQIAYLYWEGNERHVAVKAMSPR
jgi:hypothetical protein